MALLILLPPSLVWGEAGIGTVPVAHGLCRLHGVLELGKEVAAAAVRTLLTGAAAASCRRPGRGPVPHALLTAGASRAAGGARAVAAVGRATCRRRAGLRGSSPARRREGSAPPLPGRRETVPG